MADGKPELSAGTGAPSTVEALFGYLLRRTNNLYQTYWREHFIGPDGPITAMQAGMLIAINQWAPVTQSELARRMHIKAPTALQSISVLEKLSYVERTPLKDDGRSHTLSLTAKGRSLLVAVNAMVPRRDADLLANLTDTERAVLKDLLERVVAHNAALDD